MATLARGKTFGASETVTNSKLHQLVDSGSVSNIVTADFDLTQTAPTAIQSSAPGSPTKGNTWFDNTNDVHRIYDGSKFQPIGFSARILTNQSGGALTAGDVVIIDTGNASAVTTTTSAGDTDILGVVIIGGADQADVVVQTGGYVAAVTVDGSTSIGDFLRTSTTVKKANPQSSFVAGAFARALTSDSSSVAAFIGGAALIGNVSAKVAAVDTATFSRVTSTAPGTQVVSHSLGVLPSEITFYAGSTGLNNYHSTGVCYIKDASTFGQGAIIFDQDSLDHVATDGSCIGLQDENTTNSYLGAITAVTTTNFTITWSETGSVSPDITMDCLAVLKA